MSGFNLHFDIVDLSLESLFLGPIVGLFTLRRGVTTISLDSQLLEAFLHGFVHDGGATAPNFILF